jgi:hypothetical protein
VLQVTALSQLSALRAGEGTDAIDHAPSFHVSMSEFGKPAAMDDPTATHDFGAGHVTASS